MDIGSAPFDTILTEISLDVIIPTSAVHQLINMQ